MKPTKKKKTLKAWAVLNHKGGLEYEGFFPQIYIQKTKPKVQNKTCTCKADVVRIELTYELP